MKRVISLALCALLCGALFAACARAEALTFTYDMPNGGLRGLAVAPDGRIAVTGVEPHPEDQDDGQDGFLLVIGADGRELWRLTDAVLPLDVPSAPVFREDGAVVYALTSSTGKWRQTALVTANAGEIVSRALLSGDLRGASSTARGADAVEDGFLLTTELYDDAESKNPLYADGYRYSLLSPEGVPAGDFSALDDKPLFGVGARHVLAREDRQGGVGLYRIGADGAERLPGQIVIPEAAGTYGTDALVSLPDGGAAALVHAGGTDRPVRLARWDALGNQVFSADTGAKNVDGMTAFGDGVALCATFYEGEPGSAAARETKETKLLFYGPDGEKRGELRAQDVGLDAFGIVQALSELPDGRLLAASFAIGEHGEGAVPPLRLTFIAPEFE